MNKIQGSMAPTLRFKEFSDNWNAEKLGSFLSFKNGINAGKEHYGSGYKFINVLDIIQNPYIVHEKIIGSVKVDEEVFTKNEVIFGDILFQRSSEIREETGQSNVYLDDQKSATFGGFVIRGRSIKNYQPIYLNYLLKTWLARKEVVEKSGGSTRYNVGQDTLAAVNIYISTNDKEQQKIANFLSSVDKKIQQLTEKKSLLQQYKKGVMQKLFSQEIRFKGEQGNDFPNWEELRAKEIFKNHSNKKHDGSLPILAATQEGGVVYRDSIGIQIQTSEGSVKSYKVVEDGDFVISLRSFQGGIEYSAVTGICSPAYTVLKPKLPISEMFFKYYFKKESFISQLSTTVIGIRDGKQISYDAFSGMKLLYPCVEEQNKIASFLGELDKKIGFTHQQIEQTKTFKKGLLQQMFV